MDSRNKLDFTWDYAYIEDDDITCYETDIDGVYFFYTKKYDEIWLYIDTDDVAILIYADS